MSSSHRRNTGPMRASPRCGAQSRSGAPCRSPAVRGRKRCRMHGGAEGSGAPIKNQNARKHGCFTREVTEERGLIEAALREAKMMVDQLEVLAFERT